MSINIQIIADKLNLSKSTVSRALRNHPDISSLTKDRVVQLANDLGYEPNLIAQALTTKKTFTIGVIIPKIGHSFFAEALQGMGDVLYESGYQILITSSNEDSERELLNIKNLLAKKIDGLIVSVAAGTTSLTRFEELLRKKVPLVFFDRKVQGLPASSISIDYEKIYQQKLEYIASKGITKIAYVDGNPNGFYGQLKLDAFKMAVKQSKHKIKKVKIVQATPDIEGGIKAFEELYRKKHLPQLIDASASMQAMGILKAAQNHNIEIPRDLELFGNYITPVTELLTPRISGACFSIEEMGRKAATVLLEQITNENPEPVELYIDANLCFRETTKN
jgi:LacI family transcriptional regulator